MESNFAGNHSNHRASNSDHKIDQIAGPIADNASIKMQNVQTVQNIISECEKKQDTLKREELTEGCIQIVSSVEPSPSCSSDTINVASTETPQTENLTDLKPTCSPNNSSGDKLQNLDQRSLKEARLSQSKEEEELKASQLLSATRSFKFNLCILSLFCILAGATAFVPNKIFYTVIISSTTIGLMPILIMIANFMTIRSLIKTTWQSWVSLPFCIEVKVWYRSKSPTFLKQTAHT